MREVVGRSLHPLVRRFFVPILHSSFRRGSVPESACGPTFIFSSPWSRPVIYVYFLWSNVTGQGTAHLVRRTLHPLVLLFFLHRILRGVWQS